MFDVLGSSKTDEILVYLCAERRARFSDFERELGLNPSMVNRRLKSMTDLGLVEKDMGIYHITDRGKEVAAIYKILDGSACDRSCPYTDSCAAPLFLSGRLMGQAHPDVFAVLSELPASEDHLRETCDVTDLDLLLENLQSWDLVTRDEDEFHLTPTGASMQAATSAALPEGTSRKPTVSD